MPRLGENPSESRTLNALAVALSLTTGACDRSAPTEPERPAQTASSAKLAPSVASSIEAPTPVRIPARKKPTPPEVPFTDSDITVTEVYGDYCKEGDERLAIAQVLAAAKFTQLGLDGDRFVPGYLDHGCQGKMGFYPPEGTKLLINETRTELYGLGIDRPDENSARFFHEGIGGPLYSIKGNGTEPFKGWSTVKLCIAKLEGTNETVQKTLRSAKAKLRSAKVGISDCKSK